MDRKYAITEVAKSSIDKDSYMLENMSENKAFVWQKKEGDDPQLLGTLKSRYKAYRENWKGLPKYAIENGLCSDFVSQTKSPPLCVDLEVASICDLACPFCYRQHIATPDKVMRDELVYRLIDQCAEMGVPSMKFNWRGEPLMHPRVPKFIGYAKRKGILETIINTNATRLDEKMSLELIEAGLDVMIYSFDGGSERTYNKMRPGRFEENRFEDIYKNIRRFHELKVERKSKLPFTKIQMILNEETFNEVDSFYNYFNDCVDSVTVKAYTERGGDIDDLGEKEKQLISDYLKENATDIDEKIIKYWKTDDGSVYISHSRIPCEQIYQRLMVSYDGRVFMCCYDWGNEHPIGFVADDYFKNGDADYEDVLKKIISKKEGFAMMRPVMPDRNVRPEKKVESLKAIWDGKYLNGVRKAHINNKVNSIKICRKCEFKETYDWIKIG
jgi:MoaA/NifB/PqqE/SkfB family radical SAM enzyme